MFINRIRADCFRNLEKVDVVLDKRLNVFSGQNAQGKTNLIEAVWLCTGAKSFRGGKDRDFIKIGERIAEINIDFSDKQRKQNITISIDRNNIRDKLVTQNGVKLKAPSKLFGSLKCVVFTPDDLELAKGSPDNRRRFLDLSISQIKPGFAPVCAKYDAIITQRNTLIKNINMGFADVSELEVWDEQLAKLCAYISVLRYTYSKKLGEFAKRLYEAMTGGKEELTLSYSSTVYTNLEGRTDYSGEMADEYLELLKKNRKDDLRLGFTQAGTHRDDLITYVNGLSSREFCSQGQNRSVALVLKLAQAYILTEETEDSPVVLLDDVLSELDPLRQNFVLNSIDNMQVIITCCDINTIPKDKYSSVYTVSNGKISKINIQNEI